MDHTIVRGHGRKRERAWRDDAILLRDSSEEQPAQTGREGVHARVPREVVDVDDVEVVGALLNNNIDTKELQLQASRQPRHHRCKQTLIHTRGPKMCARLVEGRGRPTLRDGVAVELHRQLRSGRLVLDRWPDFGIDIVTHHKQLEKDAAMVDKLLNHTWIRQAREAGRIVHNMHLVRLLRAVRDRVLHDHRKGDAPLLEDARRHRPRLQDRKRRPEGRAGVAQNLTLRHHAACLSPVQEHTDTVQRVDNCNRRPRFHVALDVLNKSSCGCISVGRFTEFVCKLVQNDIKGPLRLDRTSSIDEHQLNVGRFRVLRDDCKIEVLLLL
eukprot:m.44960 g.44960  ORF g.44960 m.44960 type:complete len:326 (-) comp5853_c0_seq1:157-1134(-)